MGRVDLFINPNAMNRFACAHRLLAALFLLTLTLPDPAFAGPEMGRRTLRQLSPKNSPPLEQSILAGLEEPQPIQDGVPLPIGTLLVERARYKTGTHKMSNIWVVREDGGDGMRWGIQVRGLDTRKQGNYLRRHETWDALKERYLRLSPPPEYDRMVRMVPLREDLLTAGRIVILKPALPEIRGIIVQVKRRAGKKVAVILQPVDGQGNTVLRSRRQSYSVDKLLAWNGCLIPESVEPATAETISFTGTDANETVFSGNSPRAGLEEGYFEQRWNHREAAAVMEQIRSALEALRIKARQELGLTVTWSRDAENPVRRLQILTEAFLDHPDPAAAKPKVREMLAEIDRFVLERARNGPWRSLNEMAFIYPSADDWLASGIFYFQDPNQLRKRTLALAVYSERGSALAFGRNGPHLRAEFVDQDAPDIETAPALLSGFSERLNMPNSGTLGYDGAFMNGLMCPGATGMLQRLQSDVPAFDSLLARVLGRSPECFPRGDAPRFLHFRNGAFADAEVISLRAYNCSRPPAERVSLWDLTTGSPITRGYMDHLDFQYEDPEMSRLYGTLHRLAEAAAPRAGLEENGLRSRLLRAVGTEERFFVRLMPREDSKGFLPVLCAGSGEAEQGIIPFGRLLDVPAGGIPAFAFAQWGRAREKAGVSLEARVLAVPGRDKGRVVFSPELPVEEFLSDLAGSGHNPRGWIPDWYNNVVTWQKIPQGRRAAIIQWIAEHPARTKRIKPLMKMLHSVYRDRNGETAEARRWARQGVKAWRDFLRPKAAPAPETPEPDVRWADGELFFQRDNRRPLDDLWSEQERVWLEQEIKMLVSSYHARAHHHSNGKSRESVRVEAVKVDHVSQPKQIKVKDPMAWDPPKEFRQVSLEEGRSPPLLRVQVDDDILAELGHHWGEKSRRRGSFRHFVREGALLYLQAAFYSAMRQVARAGLEERNAAELSAFVRAARESGQGGEWGRVGVVLDAAAVRGNAPMRALVRQLAREGDLRGLIAVWGEDVREEEWDPAMVLRYPDDLGDWLRSRAQSGEITGALFLGSEGKAALAGLLARGNGLDFYAETPAVVKLLAAFVPKSLAEELAADMDEAAGLGRHL